MWRLLLPLLVTLTLGCQTIATTRDLDSLQSEFDELNRTAAGCASSEATGTSCEIDFKERFAAIETQTDQAIQTRPPDQNISEQQITIGLYRLAAFSALESNSGHVADFADKGKTLCLDTDNTPPRDCALLEVVGQYQVAERYAADVACLGESDVNSDAACPRSLLAAVDDFCPSVYDPLVSKTDAAKSLPLLSPSVSEFLDQQVERTRNSFRALAADLEDGLSFSQRARACDCVAGAAPASDIQAACESVTSSPEATFKAICIRRGLDRDGACPRV